MLFFGAAHKREDKTILITLISLAIAMLIFALTPGPGVFAIISRSLASGFRPAVLLVVGIVTGDLIYLLFAILGMSMIAQMLGALFVAVKICGGIYLFWLGVKIWRSNPWIDDSKQLSKKHSVSSNLLSGLLISLSNPKVILFYCGFLPTFMDLSALSVIEMMTMITIIVLVLLSVLIAYAYLASQARRLFSSRVAIKRLNRAAGGAMIATGIVIASKS